MCVPTLRLTVSVQLPAALIVTEPIECEPSYSVTLSPASPVPLTVTGVELVVGPGIEVKVITGGSG